MTTANKEELEQQAEPFAVGEPTIVLGVPGLVVEIQGDKVTIIRDEHRDHWCVQGRGPEECTWIQFMGRSRVLNRRLYKRLMTVAPAPKSGGYRRIGQVFGVSRDTARNWIKRGVPEDVAPQVARELGVTLSTLKIRAKKNEDVADHGRPYRAKSVNTDMPKEPRGPFDSNEDWPPDSSEGVFPSHYLEGVPIRAFIEGRIDHF